MEETARQRKERLQALKKRKQGSDEASADADENTAGVKPQLRFRNYVPINEEIKAQSEIKIGTPADIGDTVEKQVDQLTKEVEEAEEAKRAEEVDLFNLAPKKPNWDLRRDVEKKLAKLERRTQASIAQLIRVRLQRDTEQKTDLADAVNARQEAGRDTDDDED